MPLTREGRDQVFDGCASAVRGPGAPTTTGLVRRPGDTAADRRTTALEDLEMSTWSTRRTRANGTRSVAALLLLASLAACGDDDGSAAPGEAEQGSSSSAT